MSRKNEKCLKVSPGLTVPVLMTNLEKKKLVHMSHCGNGNKTSNMHAKGDNYEILL